MDCNLAMCEAYILTCCCCSKALFVYASLSMIQGHYWMDWDYMSVHRSIYVLQCAMDMVQHDDDFHIMGYCYGEG
eukprot:13192349-Ditylum_brightwellii.AAC.1